MKQLTVTGIAAATLLAAVSCARPSPPRGPASFLSVSHGAVAFIQWHATPRGHLHGTVTTGNTGGSAPGAMLSVNRTPFTGAVRGTAVTLTFPVMHFLHTSAHGTLSGGTLRLRLAQPDGALKQVRFSESDVASYHRAVAALRKTIGHANARVNSQLAGHPRRQASAHAEQLALAALAADSSLAHSGGLQHGLARFADGAQTARSDLATEKRDAAGGNGYCKAAFTVGGDAQKVAGDLKNVQGDTESMIPAIANIRAEMADARVRMRQLTRAGLPAPSSASAVISDAKGKVGRVIAMANTYVDRVNAIGATAKSIADNIATGRCSGARSGSWAPPVSHVRLRLPLRRSRRSAKAVLLRGVG